MANSDDVTIAGLIAIENAESHPHAVRRLREAFPKLEFVPAASVDARVSRIRLVTDPSLPEGAFALKLKPGAGGGAEITIEGGPFSGVIYGAEEFIEQSRPQGAGVAFAAGEIRKAPGLTFRRFWTWDHSTNWELSQIGQQEIGVFNPYGKPPAGFLADYKRLVDFASRHSIAAVVVYGFLRDPHGGIAAAQELCRYANERGVRILPGIAIGAYGGVYWEGDHRFNLSTWLRSRPEVAATMERGVGFQIADLDFPLAFPRSDYTVSACPSRPETMDWMTDAVSWLAETFEIGGVNIESGDYGVCGCARCRARRGQREDGRRREDVAESWSHADMADNFPRLFKAATDKRADLWLYCELQWDNLLDPSAHGALAALPRGGIYQHTVNRSYWAKLRGALTRGYVESLPTQPNVLRCQFACQWNGDRRTERYAFNARTFAEMSRVAADVGMRGLTVWGEPSPYLATVELSYLAFARFSYEPDLTWRRFMATYVAPLVGGSAMAERFVAIAEELDAHAELPVERLRRLRAEASEGSRHADDEVARRWLSLEDQIARRRFMGR
jgi:hypothetical protein